MSKPAVSPAAVEILALVASGDARVISRSVLALYNRQTASEQSDGTTREQNGVGFTGYDAKRGTYWGKWVASGRLLSGAFLAKAARMLPKYHRQLAEEYSFIMGAEAPKAEEARPASRAVRVASGVAPVHQHDCDRCRFLGQAEHGDKVYDLYICDDGCTIARFGEDGKYRSRLGATPDVPGSIHALISTLAERDLHVARYRIEGEML
jgi:hypothetical protein